MQNRDLEVELWKVYEELTSSSLDVADRKLKALELLAKMRERGVKVKPDAGAANAAAIAKARENHPPA